MVLKAFNGQLDFNEAFRYGVADIHRFLKNVANDPPTYRERDTRAGHQKEPYPDQDAGEPARRKKRLEKLRDLIIQLTRTDTRPTAPVKLVRFLDQTHVNPTDPFQWPVTNKSASFFIIFDLLGAFLSDITPAPTTTGIRAPTVQNFFFPLVSVYAKWCFELSARARNKTPLVAQVTRARKDTFYPWFFYLGTSIAGYTPKLRDSAQRTRWQYMFPLLEPGERVWNVSPEIQAQGVNRGWNFGNCAETYPFLHFFSTGMPVKYISGIATEIANITELGEKWDDYPFKPPCRNCKHVITSYGGVVGNFTSGQFP